MNTERANRLRIILALFIILTVWIPRLYSQQTDALKSITKCSYDSISETGDIIPHEYDFCTCKVYDRDGNRTSLVWYRVDSSIVNSSTYEYDASGYRIKEYYQTVDTHPYLKKEFTYDSKGNKTREQIFEPDSTLSWTTNYRYDSMGNVTERKGYSDDDMHTDEYEYDSVGNLVKTTFSRFGDNSYWSYEVETYTYDSAGNQIRRYNAYDDPPDLMQENEYDGNSNVVKEIYYTYNGTVKSMYTYKYDSLGNVIEEQRYNSDDVLEEKTTTEYSYDEHGNWLKSITYVNGVPDRVRTITMGYYE